MLRFLITLILLTLPLTAQAATPKTPAQEIQARADAALAAGKASDALDLFESAVVADPRNGAAYVGMGKAFEQLGLPGRALRYYRQALDINPRDLDALEARAKALAARGMASKADDAAAQLAKACPKSCPQLSRVNQAISKARLAAVEPAKTEPAKPAPAEAPKAQ
jgi:tetratricopeptide (TPR) repeat protein